MVSKGFSKYFENQIIVVVVVVVTIMWLFFSRQSLIL